MDTGQKQIGVTWQTVAFAMMERAFPDGCNYEMTPQQWLDKMLEFVQPKPLCPHMAELESNAMEQAALRRALAGQHATVNALARYAAHLEETAEALRVQLRRATADATAGGKPSVTEVTGVPKCA
jgi:hypothetical protein